MSADYDPISRLRALGFDDNDIEDLKARLGRIRLTLRYTRILSDVTLRGIRSAPFMYNVLNHSKRTI